MAAPDLRLVVNGRAYGGWKSARVTRGIESISGGFDLSVSDRWAEQREPWPIREEDECQITIDGIPVITGYVDHRRVGFGPEQHDFDVAGRDRTGALVDCSAYLPKKWEYLETSVLTLARRLCEPFGIAVSVQPGLSLKAVWKLTVDPGQTAFEALEHACRQVGVLAVSDGQGGLLLTRAGTARAVTALVEGENILGAAAEYDATGRFARYVVMGQRPGSDEAASDAAAYVLGRASDAGVRRTSRILVVRPEAAATFASAQKRAEWEATVRAARGESATVRVQGWKQGNGTLWPVNAIVKVRAPSLGIDGERLITQVQHTLDDQNGTVTEIGLRRTDAFVPEPVVRDASRYPELA